MAEVIDSMLDLMRRLPPTRTEENVGSLVGICPEEADELLQSVDQPLQVMVDRATGREYLACDYNRDGESYRYVVYGVYLSPSYKVDGLAMCQGTYRSASMLIVIQVALV